MGEIKCISDYIRAVEKITQDVGAEKTTVFRGEIKKFHQPCYPNLFRKKILEKNPYFEKNQFDEMAANHLTNGSTYLEKAIDAQHGGFPSRLLDVTYNCLTALYFAVTPFYYEPEDSTDHPGEDGMVYIFPVEKMYCPTGNNIIDAYNMIVTDRDAWINRERIFQKNHKLIDHIKLNPRIIAQQGAFILFQGDEGEEIPPYQYKSIRINGEDKKNLRKELRDLCGIYTGSIYPENYNIVNEIVRKTDYVNAKEFSIQTELELVVGNLKSCTEHFMEELEEAEDRNEFVRIMHRAERSLKDFGEDISSLEERKDRYIRKAAGVEEAVQQVKNAYNECIEDFFEEIEAFAPEDVEFMKDVLLLR